MSDQNQVSNDVSPYRAGSNACTRVFQSVEVAAESTYRLLWLGNEEIIFKQTEFAFKNGERLNALVEHSSDKVAAKATILHVRAM